MELQDLKGIGKSRIAALHQAGIDTFCYYHVYLIGILCRLDLPTIQENLRLAFDFANKYTPKVPFLLQ